MPATTRARPVATSTPTDRQRCRPVAAAPACSARAGPRRTSKPAGVVARAGARSAEGAFPPPLSRGASARVRLPRRVPSSAGPTGRSSTLTPRAIVKFESAGCPVFAPAAAGPVRGVVHLLGGAFTGAAPAQAYGFLAASLARAGYTVVMTPFGVTFDHSAAAAAVTGAWVAALAGLRADPATAWAAPPGVPTHGLGHSMGAHLHALAASLRLPGSGDGAGTPHASLTLLAFNNRSVSESVPVPMDGVRAAVEGFGGFAAAAAAAAGFDLGGGRPDVPVPAGAAGASPASSAPTADSLIRAGIAALTAAGVPVDASSLAGLAPALDQFGGLAGEVGAGADEFIPTPAQAKALIAAGFAVPRALLVRFADDTIDETPELGRILSGINAGGTIVEILPGTHVTPCGPDVTVGGVGGGPGNGDPPLPSLLGLLAAGGAAALQVDSRRLADRVVGFLDAQPGPRAALPA